MPLRFLLLILVPAAFAGLPAFAADGPEEESGEIILSGESVENGSPYSNAEIIPAGNSTITALREKDTGDPVYTFTVIDESLVELLRALTSSLLPPVEITASPLDSDSTDVSAEARPLLTILDGAAYIYTVTLQVQEADIRETLDQLAIASRCNMYIDSLVIIVDRCE